MIRSTLCYLVALHVCFSAGYVYADDSQTISRWCNSGGLGERYTTAAFAPKGYYRCGGLEMVAYCDAEGRKFFGKPGTQPYGYLDCGRGPRIVLKRTDPHPQAIRKDEVASTASREQDLVQSVPQLCGTRTPATAQGIQDLLNVAKNSDQSSLIQMILEGYAGYLAQLEMISAEE